MTDESPRRYKRTDELTTDEMAQRLQAQNRNEPEPKFETAEYREVRIEALRDAGLDEEADEIDAATGEKALEEMSPDEHYDRIRRNR